MKIVVIDGQGGGVGRGIIEQLRAQGAKGEIVAVGTNVTATAGMLRAGADAGATGENAVVFNCADADVVTGPIGLLRANSMYGEISPAMAAAVSSCPGMLVLIPMGKCPVQVVGAVENPLSKYLEETARKVIALCGEVQQ